MYKKIFFLLLVILFSFTPLLLAQQKEKKTIAVIDLDSRGGLTPGEIGTLTDRLRASLVRTHGFIVVERSKMQDILNEQGFQMSGCTSAECAVEAGKILGVEEMVTGTIGKLGEIYTVEIILIDVETSQIIKSISRDRPGKIEGLLEEMRIIAGELTGLKKSQPKIAFGRLKIETEPPGAQIFVDQKLLGSSPLTIPNLLSGEHQLRLRKKGYIDYKSKIRIDAEKVTGISTRMDPALALSIRSKPDSAVVYINGSQAGKTPFRGYFAKNRQLKIELKKENYKAWKTELTLDNHKSIKADLQYSEAYAGRLAEKSPVVKIEQESGNTWLWVGAGVLVAGTATWFMLQGSGAKEGVFPGPPNTP